MHLTKDPGTSFYEPPQIVQTAQKEPLGRNIQF